MAAIENTAVEPAELKAFQRVLDIAIEFMNKNYDRNEPIVLFKTPEELEKEVDIPIRDNGVGFDGVMKEIEQTIKYSVRTGHIRFFNQLWAGTDKAAVIGEWLTAVLNSSMYTYEVSPVFSLMELYILDKLRKIIGWQTGDGVFAPGGAHANLLAILAARNALSTQSKRKGVKNSGDHQLVAFTSVQSHYTIPRAAGAIGVGMENCVKVPCDSHGKMIPEELEKAIEKAKAEGKKPFFINATCGSTVLGAYDPLRAIGAIAKKHGLWFHVDACWGGHCLLSKTHKQLMDGAELANSVAWTATKCFGLPQQCAVLVLPQRNVLQSCNACNEDYLFHEHNEKEFDLGERSLNCGRRVDAFKLWVSWKVYGDLGYQQRVDHAFDNARYFADQLKKHPEKWQLLIYPESLNICFWHIPSKARGLPAGKERDHLMDEATLKIRRALQLAGKCLVNYSDLPGIHGHFFRMISCNPNATKDDMDFVINHIEQLGKDLGL